MVCFRDVPGTNHGQHSEHSDSCSSGFFSVTVVKFGLISLDSRNQLHSIIPLTNIIPYFILPITVLIWDTHNVVE